MRKFLRKIYLVQWVFRKINGALNLFVRKEKVAMFHIGRCGSTVLGYMLNDHSNFFWEGEVFSSQFYANMQRAASGEETKKISVEQTLSWHSNRRVSKIFGFETKSLPHQHLSPIGINMSLENYIKLLRKLGYSKFIVLYRKNYLRRVISAQLALQKGGAWHSKSEAERPRKMKLDLGFYNLGEDLKSSIQCIFEQSDKTHHDLKRLLGGDAALFLTYEEDILDDPMQAYLKTCSFLGISNEEPEVKLRRTNPFAYEDILSNFDEVTEILKDTAWSWMLDD